MKFINTRKEEDSSWLSISDMMAGLMMIFLFIAVLYIQNTQKYFEAVRSTDDVICNELEKEFENEKIKWSMSICEDGLLVRFSSDGFFDRNKFELKEQFQNILKSFFPRLMEIMWKHKDKVSELRIEGHTDSSIPENYSTLNGYIYNTNLSQDRSREVMKFCLNLDGIKNNEDYLKWSMQYLTAHGLSSSVPIYTDSNILKLLF